MKIGLAKSLALFLILILLHGGTPLYAGGSDQYGYTAENGENITLVGNDILISTGSIAHGLSAKQGGSINMTGGSIESYGIYIVTVLTDGGTITLKDVDVMSKSLYNNRAMLADNGGTINMTGGSMTSEQYYNIAITARENSTVTLTDVDVATYGLKSYGVLAEDNSQLTMNGGSITTYDQNGADGITPTADSYGAYANKTGSLVTLNNVDVATYGSTGKGAWALAADYGGKLVMNGGTVYTEGRYSYGIATLLGDISTYNITVETKANDTHGAYAYYTGSHVGLTETDIKTSGNGSYGVLAWDGSKIEMTSGSVSTSGDGAFGVSSQNSAGNSAGTTVTLTGASIETSGSGAHALRAFGGGTIIAETLNVKADDSKGAYALYSSGTKSAIYGADSLFNIEGAIAAENSGSIDVTMSDGSYFKGWSTYETGTSTAKLAINGEGSVWEVTKDSSLTGLSLTDSLVDYRTAELNTTITVEDLNLDEINGGGHLFMKSDIVNETADLLIVTGTTSGSHEITVRNDGGKSTTGDEITLLVSTADHNGSFALTNFVDVGGWRYALRQNTDDYENGAGWELYAEGPSPGGDGGVNNFYASYLLSYVETETLIKRLGDLRQTPDEKGFWVRLHGGGIKSNSRSYTKPFDMDYYGVHIGYDRKIEIGWDGEAYAGIMFGYSRADLDYNYGGNGEIDSKMVGLYGTWIRPNGFFADLVLKYQWMDNDMDVFDSDGSRVTADSVSTGGFGISLELGQRIPFAKSKGYGWYMEPQAQMSYMRQNGGTFNASNGLRVGVDPYTSLIGRLGLLIGYENEGKTRNFYGKVSKVKDFEGDIVVRANDYSFNYDFGSSWWVYGLGFTAKLNDRSSIYIDFERTSGARFTQDWAVKAGWRRTL